MFSRNDVTLRGSVYHSSTPRRVGSASALSHIKIIPLFLIYDQKLPYPLLFFLSNRLYNYAKKETDNFFW